VKFSWNFTGIMDNFWKFLSSLRKIFWEFLRGRGQFLGISLWAQANSLVIFQGLWIISVNFSVVLGELCGNFPDVVDNCGEFLRRLRGILWEFH